MIHQYANEHGKNTDAGRAKTHRVQKKKRTLFPKYRLEDDFVIDEILNTLREEENAAHE